MSTRYSITQPDEGGGGVGGGELALAQMQMTGAPVMVGGLMVELAEGDASVVVGPAVLNAYLAAVEAAYNPAVSYHNAVHGADAAQTLHSFMRSGLLGAAHMDAIDVFGATLAALCHDVGHPGVNAGFLCATGHELALTYNDVSPLENMHVSTAFKIAKRGEKVDVFQTLNADQ